MKTATAMLTAFSLTVAGGAGYLIGSARIELGRVLSPATNLTEGGERFSEPVRPMGTGPVIYYRHPDGEPTWSLVPSKTADGRDFLPVRASEDVSFADAAAPLETPSQAGEDAKPSAERKVLYYRNPMGLPDTSKTPKKDSMGMDYIPVYEGDADGGSTVKVSLGKLQRTGVKTAEATLEALPQTVRVPGVVVFDDRRIQAVSMRSDSFIEEIADVTTGSRVQQGDQLFRFYSKEIATAAAEFANVLAGGGDTSGSALRLRNLGVSARMIDEIARDRKVPAKMTFDAPSDGVVIERTAVPGSMAKPGEVLFRIADTSDVWMVADVPESQLRQVSPGAAASVTVAAFPGMPATGRVELVYPEIREQTRTAKVRVLLQNPDGRLLANMYGQVEIATGAPDPVLTVPNDAVVDAGRRQMVFVDKGGGRFEPRDVTLGSRGTSRVEILAGVSQGERVVVSANFLLDAESNLNSALNALTAGDAQP